MLLSPGLGGSSPFEEAVDVLEQVRVQDKPERERERETVFPVTSDGPKWLIRNTYEIFILFTSQLNKAGS